VNNSPKVLVVEDEAVMAMLYSRKLRSKGYTVTGTAATKEEAVNLAFKNPPDFVLMDIRLVGEGDGIGSWITTWIALFCIIVYYLRICHQRCIHSCKSKKI
jgi:ActR/RegA family two-component response regulator